MTTTDPLTWAYHDDFAELLAGKEHAAVLRLLVTADIGLRFAREMIAQEYDEASRLLSSELQAACPPSELRRSFEAMTQSSEGTTETIGAQAVTGADASEMSQWRTKLPGDFGWVYVSIHGRDFNEAVAVIIADEAGRLVIRDIAWGRP